MKTARDPRHLKRRKIVVDLFSHSFTKQLKLSETSKKILNEVKKIDQQIIKAAPAWPINKLNKIDLAILRLAIYEIDHKKAPPKVVIDEAVELGKEFGGENSAPFINGVLGSILKDIK